MDNIISKDGYFDTDLEKGGVNDNLDSNQSLIFGTGRMKQFSYEASGGGYGSCNESIKYEERVISSIASNCDGGSENVRLMVVDNGDCFEKKNVKEKPKAMSAKKPPKPPRPPRGLSLDSADQKLIRELHELAKLKRARTERMKALKKAKESKTSSSKNQLFATLLTILFCVVLLLQGISSRTSGASSFQGSPISSGVTEGSVISVHQYPVLSASNVNGPGFEYPRLVERVSGLDTPEKMN